MEVEMMPIVNHSSSLRYIYHGDCINLVSDCHWANTSIINSATGSKPLNRQENKRVYNLVEKPLYVSRHENAKINIIYDSS